MSQERAEPVMPISRDQYFMADCVRCSA